MEPLLGPPANPDELTTLFAIQQAITSHLEPEAVLQLIAAEAQRLTGSRRAAVFLLQGDSLRLAAGAGGEPQARLLDYRMPVAGSLIGLAIETGRPLCVQNVQDDPHVQADPRRQVLMRQTGASSVLVVPLLSVTRAIGAISITDKIVGPFGPDDERILLGLASSAVIGLENARLYRREQERRQGAEGLRDVLASLNSDRPLADILTQIVTQAVQLLQAAASAMYRLEEDQNTLAIQAAAGLPEAAWTGASLKLADSPLGQVITGGRPVALPDLAGRPDIAPALPYEAVLAVPVKVKTELYGLLVLYFARPHDFSPEEIERTVTTHVSNILRKLHLANRSQVTLYALREGLIDPDSTAA